MTPKLQANFHTAAMQAVRGIVADDAKLGDKILCSRMGLCLPLLQLRRMRLMAFKRLVAKRHEQILGVLVAAAACKHS